MTRQQIDHVERLTKVIGAAWSIRILYVLMQKDARFNEIANEIKLLYGEEITRRVLSLRLSELQDLELVVKNKLAIVPVQFMYSLTQKGNLLINSLGNSLD